MNTATPSYDLFAINESTGQVNWQQPIQASPTNDTNLTFNPDLQLQRTGLLLLNGAVYMGFGADCADLSAADGHAYNGYIAGVSTTPESGSTTHAETLWSDQSDLTAGSGSYGGIWQGGGGLVTDGSSIYFSTGNGSAPPLKTADTASGIASVEHFGQSMVKLNVKNSGTSTWTLQPGDFFSPGNADVMSSFDHDFGSGGPIMLPFTTKDYPKGLFFTADKEAFTYLLNAASLGGRASSATGSTAVWTGQPSFVDNPPSASATIPSVGHGLWGHAAAIAGANGADYIYYEGTGWSGYAQMYAFKFNGSNPKAPTLTNVASTDLPAPTGFPVGDTSAPRAGFGFSSGSPDITSNGTSLSSAVVWEVYAPNSGGVVAATSTNPEVTGQLMAFAAQPTANGTLQKIWSSPIGDAAEFTVPATSAGRVYVAARNDGGADAASGSCGTDFGANDYASIANSATNDACVGEVYGYGTRSAQLAGPTVNLGHVRVGQTDTKMVTLTNTGDTPVQITKVASPSVPFGTPVLPAFNQPIAPGASISFPVTFTPQARGTITAKYTVTTTDGFATRTNTVTVEGVGAPPVTGTTAVASPGGGWTLNGSSAMTGTTLQLTPAKASQVGSAVFYQPVPSNGLHAQFTVRLNGGNGGDGMTFSLLNPATATTARGAGAGELGYGGLNGISVVLGTRKDAGDPSANFVGIATGTSRGHLVYAATGTPKVNLRSGTPTITVTRVGQEGHRRGQREGSRRGDRPDHADRAARLHRR